MIILISPAKTLDFSQQDILTDFSNPNYLDEASFLVEYLKKLNPKKLSNLMNISSKLAQLNYERFQQWHLPFSNENAKQAILAFKGDVYTGIEATSYSNDDFEFVQKHLRILSGLYGILKPLDLIQPYRLEMGTSLKTKGNKDLYSFWMIKLTSFLREELITSKSKYLINLASNEYYKAIDTRNLDINIITPVFKDFKNGQYKFLSVYGKKARGLMTSYIIKNRIKDPEQMKLFDVDGYYYNDNLSNENEWVFTRG